MKFWIGWELNLGKKKFNLCIPKPTGNGGTWWHKVGTAFYDEESGSMNVKLDSLPAGTIVDPRGNEVPWNGWVRGFADDGQRQGGGGSGGYAKNRDRGGSADNGGKMGDQIEDEIPF